MPEFKIHPTSPYINSVLDDTGNQGNVLCGRTFLTMIPTHVKLFRLLQEYEFVSVC